MTSGAARLIAERGFGDLIGVKVNKHRTQGIQSEEYVEGLLPGVTKIRVPHRGSDWDELETTSDDWQIASYFCDMLGEKHIGTALFKNSKGGRVAVYAQNSDMQGGLFGSHARLRWLHGVLLWLTDNRFPALPVTVQHGVSLLKTKDGKSLYCFSNLGTDVLTSFTLRWSNASAIRSIQCLQRDGSWQPVQFSIIAKNATPTEMKFETNLNCYDWLVLLIESL